MLEKGHSSPFGASRRAKNGPWKIVVDFYFAESDQFCRTVDVLFVGCALPAAPLFTLKLPHLLTDDRSGAQNGQRSSGSNVRKSLRLFWQQSPVMALCAPQTHGFVQSGECVRRRLAANRSFGPKTTPFRHLFRELFVSLTLCRRKNKALFSLQSACFAMTGVR